MLKTPAALLMSLLALWPVVSSGAELRGVVTFGGQPIPGATISAKQGDKAASAVTDANGSYSLDLAEGDWKLEADMLLFASAAKDVHVPPEGAVDWDLTLVPEDQLNAMVTAAPVSPPTAVTTSAPTKPGKNTPAAATNTNSAFQRTALAATNNNQPANQPNNAPTEVDPEAANRAADGLLINGSVNNSASSSFSTVPAFGNNRRGTRSLYNGNLGLIFNNSAFDARSYSLTGQNTAKPNYARYQGVFNFGGPVRIPKIATNTRANFNVNYQWTRNRNANTQPGLMPTADERNGILSHTIIDPTTGQPFPGNQIPYTSISPQAKELLKLYPNPNFAGSDRYNFQIPIVSGTHQDDLQSRLSKQIGNKEQLQGNFNFQSTRTDTPNLFGFLSNGRSRGINSAVSWRHLFNARTFLTTGITYSSQSASTIPYYANRSNISALAGIAGNNQDPTNWGPPALSFSQGITGLSDVQPNDTRNQTTAFTADAFFNRGRHNITAGGALRFQQFNVLNQQNPRGTLAFTGTTTNSANPYKTGSDFASFLLGLPDTSQIAYGNADKYLRGRVYESYFSDDWRINPALTLNLGLRWDYWSPLEEKYDRLVNLAIGPGYTTATPALGSTIHPDRNNLSPRIAFSWRPLAASSLIVRGGYGVYYDTSIYQPIVNQMTQQAPLSTSVRITNSPTSPLTLANPFVATASVTNSTTFAVDPNLKVGYSQNWQLSIQRDLPAALQMTIIYAGIKGTRAQQQFLPNTFPTGSGFLPTGPVGFTYLTSNGNSTRESGQIQIRRRLRSGFTAQAQYTWSKSIDNAALGGRGNLIAQNWLDLQAERARSNFDQRHLLNLQAQYTSGMGLRGGALTKGWKAVVLKDWTLGTQMNIGSGLPLTPTYLAPVRGAGVTGSQRASFTGADIYAAPDGFFLNPAALTVPAAGQWGNAGRNTITGPKQFVVNAAVSRTFRSAERVSFDYRAEAANVLNIVTWQSWNTVVGNQQFGLPTSANQMRSMQMTLRMRF